MDNQSDKSTLVKDFIKSSESQCRNCAYLSLDYTQDSGYMTCRVAYNEKESDVGCAQRNPKDNCEDYAPR